MRLNIKSDGKRLESLVHHRTLQSASFNVAPAIPDEIKSSLKHYLSSVSGSSAFLRSSITGELVAPWVAFDMAVNAADATDHLYGNLAPAQDTEIHLRVIDHTRTQQTTDKKPNQPVA